MHLHLLYLFIKKKHVKIPATGQAMYYMVVNKTESLPSRSLNSDRKLRATATTRVTQLIWKKQCGITEETLWSQAG